MIDRFGRQYVLSCDVCGEEITFYEFDEAVDYKAANRWHSKRYGDDWVDVCPDCVAKEAQSEFGGELEK